ncbi:MAG: hypothetical protein RI922_547 [Bacteroidota bacterium]|jgi:hypothetical protein
MKKLLTILTLLFTVMISTSSFGQNLVWTNNTSSPAACDGSAYIDSNVVVTNQVWAGNGMVYQTGGNNISGLCAGTYTLTYTDFFGNNITTTFTIGSGSSNPCSGFTASVTVTDATDLATCDGTASVNASGGSAPYVYQWSNGQIGGSIGNLCVGTYDCYVTDANGCSTSGSGYVADASANMLDSVLIFINTSYPGVSILDTLSLAMVEDCTIDYSIVDSAGIVGYYYSAVDTVVITWALYDANGNIVATYIVPTFISNANTGVFEAILIVYCSQKSLGYNTIEIHDQVYLNSSQMGIEENTSTNLTVVNPIVNEVNVQFEEISSGSATLVDMNGRTIAEMNYNNETSIAMNTLHVQAGTYFLTIVANGQTLTAKLIK